MKWVSAISDLEDSGQAVDAVVTQLRERLEGLEPDLLLVFSSPDHTSLWDELPNRLLDRLGGRALIGCSGGGIIGDGREVEQRSALSVCAAALPDVKLTTLHLANGQLPESNAGWHERLGFGPDEDASFIVLPDPFGFDADDCLTTLQEAFPQAPILGGLASGGILPRTNAVFVDGGCHREGAALLALRGNIAIDPIIAQGCRPVGDTMLVSSCDGHIIHGLDNMKPGDALQALHASLDEDDRDLMRDSLFMGVEMADQREYRAGDFLIRNIVGLQPDGGALAVATLLERWQAVQFHLRDQRASREDLERQLDGYRDADRATEPAGALLFSCLGRGEQLYGEPHHDSSRFGDKLGDLGLAGFFCNGEIGPVGGKVFLHGYTSAFAVVRPKH
jgi:small ligand-binding sensory domain FIST